jgi:hypothetical protein
MLRVLPSLLILAALLADAGGGHGVALSFVLLAVPAAFALALACYGDALEERCSLVRPAVAGLAAALLVLSAALRSSVLAGGVPALAISALVLTLLLYAALGIGALLPGSRTVPESA